MGRVTVPLSARAVESRIKRKYESEGVTFTKPRPGSRAFHDIGPYYLVDEHHAVLAVWQDIQSAAVETAGLEPWERIELG